VDLESFRVDCAALTRTALGLKEAEMKLIGCDLHARQQAIVMLDRAPACANSSSSEGDHDPGQHQLAFSSIPLPGQKRTGHCDKVPHEMVEHGLLQAPAIPGDEKPGVQAEPEMCRKAGWTEIAVGRCECGRLQLVCGPCAVAEMLPQHRHEI